MAKLNLYGDSVIDNYQYVEIDERSVLAHLKFQRPTWEFGHFAIDGHTSVDVVQEQLKTKTNVPSVLSVGGNDLLRRMELLTSSRQMTGLDVLEALREILIGLGERIKTIIGRLTGPSLVCTIYNPDFLRDEYLSPFQRSAELVISAANDIIQREALLAGKEILELRDIFSQSTDFANPIEPSDKGGLKLANAIVSWREQL